MNVIECRNLRKEYKDFIFSDNSFSIEKGRIVGLIGENGAGKTTLINLLLNKISRDSGDIFIFGKDLAENEVEIKMNTGVVLDECHLPAAFNIKEIEAFMSKIYTNWNKKEFQRLRQMFHLPLDKKVEGFSRGMKKKLDIAAALSHEASLLILDEPTSGLDFTSARDILKILQKEAEKHGKTILFSTHNMNELDELVDDIIMLKKGKIVLNDTKENIKRKYFLLEVCEQGLGDIQRKVKIEDMVTEEGKFRILMEKSENILTDSEYKIRQATLEEIIYIKMKGEEKYEGVSHKRPDSD